MYTGLARVPIYQTNHASDKRRAFTHNQYNIPVMQAGTDIKALCFKIPEIWHEWMDTFNKYISVYSGQYACL